MTRWSSVEIVESLFHLVGSCSRMFRATIYNAVADLHLTILDPHESGGISRSVHATTRSLLINATARGTYSAWRCHDNAPIINRKYFAAGERSRSKWMTSREPGWLGARRRLISTVIIGKVLVLTRKNCIVRGNYIYRPAARRWAAIEDISWRANWSTPHAVNGTKWGQENVDHKKYDR